MRFSRRQFVGTTAAAVVIPRGLRGHPAPPRFVPADRFDPWVEIDPAALRHNVTQVSRLAGDRPILAVVKNNAYGLDLTTTARILEPYPEIAGFAVVKVEAAIALRDAGITKPVLQMGLFEVDAGIDMAARGIHLSASTDDAGTRLGAVAERLGRPIPAHLYLDTGMGRMGIPVHRAIPWIADLGQRRDLIVDGTYMAFTEETEFDKAQLQRFMDLRDTAAARSIPLGRLHAASSNGVYHLPEAHLDLVRPGIAIFGAYPSRPAEEHLLGPLRCALRLKSRVVRVERLRVGDGVSYGRNYVADRSIWTATLPMGHVDGIPRSAVKGAQLLINERLFPVIGAVSASHCIVEVGDEQLVNIGDTATFIGPDRPEIQPNHVAGACGVSVYDILMHLNPGLPRIVL